VLAESGNTLNIVGKLEGITPGEQLYSAQFIGDRAFLVTFHRTDPLIVVNLSDPTNPQIVGELVIPGYSTYLQPIGQNYLIGIGTVQNDVINSWNEGWVLQISLFNISDPSKPVLVDRYSFSPGTWSPAQYDSHAVSYFADTGTLALPVGNSLMVFHVDPKTGFKLVGQVSHDSQVLESVQIGRDLYSVAQDSVKVQLLNDPDNTIAEVNLPTYPPIYWYWPPGIFWYWPPILIAPIVTEVTFTPPVDNGQSDKGIDDPKTPGPDLPTQGQGEPPARKSTNLPGKGTNHPKQSDAHGSVPWLP
jgi:inhibitor of cysteine peptidase